MTMRGWSAIQCAVERCPYPCGRKSRPATVAPAGSNRSVEGGDKLDEAFDVTGRLQGGSASMQAVT